jgi:CHAD domain-containing protein
LVVERGFEVPPTERLGKRVASATTETVRQHAVYFDTADLRLTRSGASLRYRSDDGWTVKLPESRTASTLTRSEHTFAGEPGPPPSKAVSLVCAFARTRPLVEIAKVDTRRRKMRLFDDAGELLAELDDDEVEGTSATTGRTRFREIEVELAERTADEFLDEVVRALRKAGARPSGARSKVARVLGDAATAAPDVPDAPPLDARATVEDLVRDAFVRSVQQLFTFDPGVRLGDDPEAVHKARVATRRLRSDLRTLRPVVDRAWSEPLRSELKWLGTVLGHVRDDDVLLAGLEREADQLPPELRDVATQVRARVGAARRRDRSALQDALDSDRYARLLDRLVDGAARPRFEEAVGRKRASKLVRTLVDKPRRRFRKYVRALGDDARDVDLHEARKRAKQARYAFEFVEPILGKRAAKSATRFEAVQELLGDHQDAVVAGKWLADTAQDVESRDESYAAGVLAGLFLVRRRTARAQWPQVRDGALRVKR